jgi:beta-xylosidase
MKLTTLFLAFFLAFLFCFSTANSAANGAKHKSPAKRPAASAAAAPHLRLGYPLVKPAPGKLDCVPNDGKGQFFTNPLSCNFVADPMALVVGNVTYLYSTGGGLMYSEDLFHWKHQRDLINQKHMPSWWLSSFWAIHVIKREINGKTKFIMYFSAQRKKNLDCQTPNTHTGTCFSVGVAIADSPKGPFKPLEIELTRGQQVMAIDPWVGSIKGKLYLYYGSGSWPIRYVPLADDGLSLAKGHSKDVMTHKAVLSKVVTNPTQKLIEGAWLKRHGKFWYLFYSGPEWRYEGNYQISVARSKNPFDFTKAPRYTVVAGNKNFLSPGHNTMIKRCGKDYLIYGMFSRGDQDVRRLGISEVVWQNGWPTVANHSPALKLAKFSC